MFLFDLADISETGSLVCEQKLRHIYDDVFIFNKSDVGKVALKKWDKWNNKYHKVDELIRGWGGEMSFTYHI